MAAPAADDIMNPIERTRLAAWRGTTHILTEPDDQGMIFVKNSIVRRQRVHKHLLDVIITCILFDQVMPMQKTPRVSIDDKNWFIKCIEQNGIRGLRPDAVDGKQILT